MSHVITHSPVLTIPRAFSAFTSQHLNVRELKGLNFAVGRYNSWDGSDIWYAAEEYQVDQ